jgi:isochorismate synthase EntC
MSLSELRDFVLNLPEEFAIIEDLDGSLEVITGPFERHPQICSAQNYIYLNNFYLSDAKPYLSFSHQFTISPADRVLWQQNNNATFANTPELIWQDSSKANFKKSFEFFNNLLSSAKLLKAVPVIFKYAHIKTFDSYLPSAISKLICGKAGLLSYAIKHKDYLMLGASPEILFNINPQSNTIQTEAVAGSILGPSAPLKQITDKLLEEHSLVVEDLVSQLSIFGTAKVEEVKLKNLSSLCHLRSAIEVNYQKLPNFDDLIKLLHPSGALGLLPRAKLNSDLYRSLDSQECRSTFGAPFGLIRTDGSAQIIVAIRNIILVNKVLKIGAGVGLTAKSELDSEWKEILGKQSSVKEFFGIT